MLFSCENHVEEALEEALEDEGLPPDFEILPPEVRTSKKCFFCHEQATYQVTPRS
ncbi:CxxH/CxxC protein [Salipaludibacillus keqinensis]|uniref:CxxH/CxxC protein n=1 Tax=Salipaludibacillus keqinensis TaxID=2045207 RepID=A0A323TR10_9BACI|nr:CxxH/CxxC protein [Salipaludibacillus keqinensis]PYZ91765.1 CxxH/CxxC protein [Salipaludibacillus keqinensis]